MAHRIDRQRKVWVAPSVLGLLVAASAGAALAQRNNESPAIELPRLAPAAAPHDVVPDFAVTYRRAGSPKVVLLWNRTFNDVSQAAVQAFKLLETNPKSPG